MVMTLPSATDCDEVPSCCYGYKGAGSGKMIFAGRLSLPLPPMQTQHETVDDIRPESTSNGGL